MAYYDRVLLTTHGYRIMIPYIRRKNSKAFKNIHLGKKIALNLMAFLALPPIVAQL